MANVTVEMQEAPVLKLLFFLGTEDCAAMTGEEVRTMFNTISAGIFQGWRLWSSRMLA